MASLPANGLGNMAPRRRIIDRRPHLSCPRDIRMPIAESQVRRRQSPSKTLSKPRTTRRPCCRSTPCTSRPPWVTWKASGPASPTWWDARSGMPGTRSGARPTKGDAGNTHRPHQITEVTPSGARPARRPTEHGLADPSGPLGFAAAGFLPALAPWPPPHQQRSGFLGISVSMVRARRPAGKPSSVQVEVVARHDQPAVHPAAGELRRCRWSSPSSKVHCMPARRPHARPFRRQTSRAFFGPGMFAMDLDVGHGWARVKSVRRR